MLKHHLVHPKLNKREKAIQHCQTSVAMAAPPPPPKKRTDPVPKG
jgi:hypothetical protein